MMKSRGYEVLAKELRHRTYIIQTDSVLDALLDPIIPTIGSVHPFDKNLVCYNRVSTRCNTRDCWVVALYREEQTFLGKTLLIVSNDEKATKEPWVMGPWMS
jgi:hypothetical protein